jgi:hypothetical protein
MSSETSYQHVVFTPKELERLAVYRLAVAAGFFNEGFTSAAMPAPAQAAAQENTLNGLDGHPHAAGA